MTFIIAVQAKDSVIVAGDTQKFIFNNQSMVPSDGFIQKVALDIEGNVCASSGIDAIANLVFDEIIHNDICALHKSFVKCSNEFLKYYKDIPIIAKQIYAASLYCSVRKQEYPALYAISMGGFEEFEVNSIRVLSFIDDVSCIFPQLLNLKSNIRSNTDFVSDIDWAEHYLELIQPIFKIMHTNHCVSQDFHIYLANRLGYIFEHIPNT